MNPKKLKVKLILILKRKNFDGHVILLTNKNIKSKIDPKYFDHDLVFDEILKNREYGFNEFFVSAAENENENKEELFKRAEILYNMIKELPKEKIRSKIRIISVESVD